ncbi:MAG: ribosome biogenesis GTPase Der [Myxococcota bacterium]|nr:ribosome biogenesis GTPase Der [Myxococcota bacterium]
MVALIGRANVGKSTLFNRLARQRRALVEDRPGVTRDRLVATARIEGRDLLLVDTGGLDPDAERGIPAAVRAQARRAVEDATVILFVVDAREGVVPLDREIADLLRRAERQVVLVANKADSPQQDVTAGEFHKLGFEEVIPVSGEHRRGIGDLEVAIAERLAAVPDASAAVADPAARVAVVGRPNVGKSSLVNRLVGEIHAVVADEPGTTRDATDIRVRVGDQEVVLIDTAGLRRRGRRDARIERGSALMALRSIERADVVLLLIDSAEGVADQDLRIARLAVDRGRPVLLILHKWDAVGAGSRALELEREVDRKLRFLPERRARRVSALTGAGTGQLLPMALRLAERSRVELSTADLNRALEAAAERLQPPMGGRRRARLFYATQVATRPLTILIFVNDPSLIPTNYRRYLVSFMKEHFGLQEIPIRVRLRGRPREQEAEEGA